MKDLGRVLSLRYNRKNLVSLLVSWDQHCAYQYKRNIYASNQLHYGFTQQVQLVCITYWINFASDWTFWTKYKYATKTTLVDTSTYCHLVGKLIFLCHTCPHILGSVELFSRFIHKLHWNAIQHILQYINISYDSLNFVLALQKVRTGYPRLYWCIVT